AVYDPVSRECTIASAGHPLPAVAHPGGEVVFPDVPIGPPIGLGTRTYPSANLTLPEGSVIALYTDGLDDVASRVVNFMTPQAWHDAAPGLVPGPDPGPGTTTDHDDITLLLARTRTLTAEQARACRRP
ncbi:PP2C family protein-serine/threonine phosphatase, partial [Actinacidiphila rubida]|uniref:PP2C family protein-serine/threonine phosphatase n=1 Tax=Actinacidiphila rubida TaxID=310780 RepID=UPI000A63A722